ncbi:hypothetical protein LCGC14_0371740 [marine sediment metagenome]|uniref:Uncharacterized protein n=1 Tax=marine sediment metagenome TaxID=412755 RepID=A0A0F9TN22_9ZZZZ
MKIWEKNGWVFVQLMDRTTNEMMIDFSVHKRFWKELKEHIIKYLNEFELDSGEKGVAVVEHPAQDGLVAAGTTDSKSESKKDDDHQSIADMMVDDALERGDF